MQIHSSGLAEQTGLGWCHPGRGFSAQATGKAERETAVDLVNALGGTDRITLGADKNYDTKDFVENMRGMLVTPHVAQNDTNRSSAIDGRTLATRGI